MKSWRVVFEAVPRYTFLGQATAWQKALAGAAFGLSCLFVIWQAWQAWQQWQSIERSQARVQTLQAQAQETSQRTSPKSPQGTSPSAKLSNEQRQGINQVIRQLNTPWSSIFEQIEQATPAGVALIQVEPDGQQGIKLQAESKSLDTLLAYAASLQHRGVLGSLVYSKHETNEQDTNKPIRLSFQLGLARPITERLESSEKSAQSTPSIKPSNPVAISASGAGS
jgi:Tfp pilus assembly protein PilN